MKNPVYHIVSHVHWDREWVTSSGESRVLLVDFMDDLLRLLEEDPRFSSFILDGQVAMVEDYLEIRPDRLRQLKNFVNRGRLFIGPWYVLADEFLPSGESLVRNLLYGAVLARRYGSFMPVGYLVDQFGHIAQMPQLLDGFDIRAAVIYRGFGGEEGQERSEYRWKSPDGSSALMLHLPRDGYSFGYFANDDDEQSIERFRRLKDELDRRALTSHRLIMNGGDRHWPDRRVADVVSLLRSRLGVEARHSTIMEVIEGVESELSDVDLPVWEGESRFGLRHAFAVIGGTASSRMYVKQANYHSQVLLEKVVEPLQAIAVACGCRDRSRLLRHAWLMLLQNQEHDVICGTSVDRVYREVMARFQHVRELAGALQRQLMADLIPNRESSNLDDKTLVLFNPLPRLRKGVFECAVEFHIHDQIIGLNPDAKTGNRSEPVTGFVVKDERGGEVPFQVVKRETAWSLAESKYSYPRQFRADRFSIILPASVLRPTGFTKLSVSREMEFSRYENRVSVGERHMENDLVRVVVNDNGSLTVTDKTSGNIVEGLNVFEDGGDVGDAYSYCPPDQDMILRSVDHPCEVEVVEEGPLRGALELKTEMDISVAAAEEGKNRAIETVRLPITSRVALAAGSRRIDITTTVENRARDHRLRVVFETGIRTTTSSAHTPFAVVERVHRKHDWDAFAIEKPLNLEVMQEFVTVQDDRRGLTLFARGLPEYELGTDGSGTIALTLLRCVGALSRGDLKTRPGGDAAWKNDTPEGQCPGRHVFEYSLLAHGPKDDFDEILCEASDYHTPVVWTARRHEVENASLDFFLKLEGEGIVWSCLKNAGDGRGMIWRIYNPTSFVKSGTMECSRSLQRVLLVGLNEKVIEEIPVKSNRVEIHLEPYKILTLRIETA